MRQKLKVALIGMLFFMNVKLFSQQLNLTRLREMTHIHSIDSIDIVLRSFDYKFENTGEVDGRQYLFYSRINDGKNLDGIFVNIDTVDNKPFFSILTVSNSEKLFYFLRSECQKRPLLRRKSESLKGGKINRIFCDGRYMYMFQMESHKQYDQMYSVGVSFDSELCK